MTGAVAVSQPAISARLLARLACPQCRGSLRLEDAPTAPIALTGSTVPEGEARHVQSGDAVGEAQAAPAPASGQTPIPASTPNQAVAASASFYASGTATLECTACGRTFPIEGGVPLLFPEERPADWTVSQRELYDGVAPHYDTSIPAHVALHYRRKRVDVVRNLASPGAAVLDVGCGTGTLAEAMREAGYDVYGLDASTGMLGQLGAAGRGTPAAGFCERLPFADGAFDLAITVATLHHITDPGRIAQTIGEMCRVTRSGGHIVIWDHNPKNPYWPYLMKRIPQDTGDERLVPQEEVVQDLRAAGIREIKAIRSGLMPDFTPPALRSVVQFLEGIVERTPGLNIFCAHNVVIGRKRE